MLYCTPTSCARLRPRRHLNDAHFQWTTDSSSSYTACERLVCPSGNVIFFYVFSDASTEHREDNRQAEIKDMVSKGIVPVSRLYPIVFRSA